MNPIHAFQDIAAAVQSAHRVVIIGLPASGKTTLAMELGGVGLPHRIVHTDDEYPSDSGASDLLHTELLFAASIGWRVMIVGVLGYRLLRKCVENGGEWLPDLVVEVKCGEETRAARYAGERPTKDYRRIASFCKGLETVNRVWKESEFSKNVRHMVYVTD
jgi:energy-coupling factor transporter ATP-binding protein EcfA2